MRGKHALGDTNLQLSSCVVVGGVRVWLWLCVVVGTKQLV